jgi:hypothetical protein
MKPAGFRRRATKPMADKIPINQRMSASEWLALLLLSVL